MDQHRDTLEIHGQTDSTQLHNNLEELHRTIARLQALQVEYLALVERARGNIRNSQILEEEVNTVARSAGPYRKD